MHSHTDLENTNADLDFSTPMMQQYLNIKYKYEDCLLWFRLGDFYEMFLEDAKIGAQVLDITLTSRTRGKDGRIPMAGIPYHAAESYLAKLVKAGYKVAICEQLTQPDGKGLVERDVVRVVTPGTLMDEKNLQRKENNFLMSWSQSKHAVGVAVVDISTGEFRTSEFMLSSQLSLEGIVSEVIAKLEPSECIVSPQTYAHSEVTKIFAHQKKMRFSSFANWEKWTKRSEKKLEKVFSSRMFKQLKLSAQPEACIASCALLGYIEETQKSQAVHIHQLQPLFPAEHLHLDRSTIMNLELTSTLRNGEKFGSLLDTIDHTITAMGGRLLKQWVLQPLCKKVEIDLRLESVAELLSSLELRNVLHQQLVQVIDIERLMGRLSVQLGNPKDLKNLQHSLEVIQEIQKQLEKLPVTQLKKITQRFSPVLQEVISFIHKTIVEDPPFDPRQGWLALDGIHSELDTLRRTVRTSREWVTQMEAAERKRTGISSLKVKFNQVFGFYIEVSKSNLHAVPENYMRKQTLVNAERFITPELKHHEEVILQAEEKMNKIEYQIFLDAVEKILKYVAEIQDAAQGIAELDCLLSFAITAEKFQYVKPEITDDGQIVITQGRHPVVENILPNQQFVPNDAVLNNDNHQLLLITGPNMAGKSVFMRQIALICLLSHIGSFVPAKKAKISVTDQIFVRSGAADMITAGLSTFMVEMVETAYILRHATEKSLVIMDEIGRGTSTYDGISIAWAVAEYLVKNCEKGPKTLFATHYHELQALEQECPDKIKNYHMAISEHDGKPVFLYTLTEGGASHSFGVAVADLAGVPEAVISRAKKILGTLEKEHSAEHTALFSPPEQNVPEPAVPPHEEEQELLSALQGISIEHLTPLQALNVLAEWKKKWSSLDG